MSLFSPPEGNGLVLGSAERLEALAWALRECGTFCEVEAIRLGAPFRSLVKYHGPIAEQAARLYSARWKEVDAAYKAADAARRYREPGKSGV